jgi:hypothetical protein
MNEYVHKHTYTYMYVYTHIHINKDTSVLRGAHAQEPRLTAVPLLRADTLGAA